MRFLSNWFHYLPWNNEPEKMGKTAEELLEWEKTEHRYNMIQKVLPYFEKYASQSDLIPVIVGGDMNSPSHLDWSKKTKKFIIILWYLGMRQKFLRILVFQILSEKKIEIL